MKPGLPSWALQPVVADDYALARDAHRRGTLQVKWPDMPGLRAWAKRQGWPAPWFGFQDAFLHRLLEDSASFALAVRESRLEMQAPRQTYTLSAEMLEELDALYAERSSNGRPTDWGALVEALSKIRRAVESGVSVEIEGSPPIQSWQAFYEWAHGRYYMLEDGYDHWIGDDAS